jgi:hypothetical protein
MIQAAKADRPGMFAQSASSERKLRKRWKAADYSRTIRKSGKEEVDRNLVPGD